MDRVKKEEPKEPTKPQFSHRYFCDACTHIATFVDNTKPFPKFVTCQVCEKTFGFKEENLIRI